MNKRKILAGLLLISIAVGATGCSKDKVASGEKNNDVTIIKDTKDIKATKRENVKIDKYENISGAKWIDENNIIISKINKEIPPVKIDTKTVKADIDLKNIYLYNIDSKNEKVIGDKSEYTEEGYVSPDRNHIFYTTEYEKDDIGYVSDSNGNIITKISDKDIDTYDFLNASWINDKEIIIPCHSIGGFAIININGQIEKISGVEKITNKGDLDGISMIKPIKVGDKIYYTKIHRGQKEDNKLLVYDIKTKEKKMLIKDDVIEFKLSNDKERLAVIVYNGEKEIHELTIMDLNGTDRKIISEGSINGIDWSKDNNTIAYTSYEEYESGVYTVDINTKEKKLIIEGQWYYGVEYSPSGEKLMVNSTIDVNDAKTSDAKLFKDQMSIMNIVSFK